MTSSLPTIDRSWRYGCDVAWPSYRPSTFWVGDPLILCWQISHQAGLVYAGYFDAGTGEPVDVFEGGWA